MSRDTFRHKVERLLALADVEIGGNRPWDIQVHNDRFYARVLAGGSLALGRSYMDGGWDCSRLDEFFCRILRTQLDTMVKPRTWYFDALKARLFNHIKMNPSSNGPRKEEGGRIMASDFKILVHRNSENLHLRLTGDFDETSAHQLLNALEENCANVRKIFVHTSCLKKIYNPFAQELFQKDLHFMNGQSPSLIFTCENGKQIAPEGSRFL